MNRDASGFIAGEAIELTSDNDELGELMFGHCWPVVKTTLAAQEKEPPCTYTVRVTSVTPARTRRRG